MLVASSVWYQSEDTRYRVLSRLVIKIDCAGETEFCCFKALKLGLVCYCSKIHPTSTDTVVATRNRTIEDLCSSNEYCRGSHLHHILQWFRHTDPDKGKRGVKNFLSFWREILLSFEIILNGFLLEKKKKTNNNLGLDGKYTAFIYNENGSGYHSTCEKEIYENHRAF